MTLFVGFQFLVDPARRAQVIVEDVRGRTSEGFWTDGHGANQGAGLGRRQDWDRRGRRRSMPADDRRCSLKSCPMHSLIL